MAYKNIEVDVGATIDEVVNLLLSYAQNGEKARAEFNGHILYSDSVTIDKAYKAITGMTKSEFDSFVSSEEQRFYKKQ